MSCTLTEYRKPHPHYPTADAGWRPVTGWELSEGVWRRNYRNGNAGARSLRMARVWRKDGAWTWRVQTWTGRHWENVANDGCYEPHYTAQAAWPFAELAAVTR